MVINHRFLSVVRNVLLGLSVPAVSIALGYLLIVLFPNTPVPPIPSSSQQHFDSLLSADLNHSILDNRNYNIGILSSGLSPNPQLQFPSASTWQNLTLSAVNFQTQPTLDSNLKFQPLSLTSSPISLSNKISDSALTNLVSKPLFVPSLINPSSTISYAETSSQSQNFDFWVLLNTILAACTVLLAWMTLRCQQQQLLIQQKHFNLSRKQNHRTKRATHPEISRLKRGSGKDDDKQIIITDL